MSSPTSQLSRLGVPSAIISDGIITVPLFAVTTMTLNETYALPAIGSTTARAVVASHDDTVTLIGMLIGPQRYAEKLALETLADTSRRGSALGAFTQGRFSGLILLTAMTIRTDMQVQTLQFSASAARRDVLEVTITLAHLPLPSALGKLLDVASVGVGALADWAGH
jgi:hypothetical protein